MQATIHNEFLTLTVDTHGAEAVSLKNAAGQEMLWQADPAVWKRHAPILFPWTGKLTGGSALPCSFHPSAAPAEWCRPRRRAGCAPRPGQSRADRRGRSCPYG